MPSIPICDVDIPGICLCTYEWNNIERMEANRMTVEKVTKLRSLIFFSRTARANVKGWDRSIVLFSCHELTANTPLKWRPHINVYISIHGVICCRVVAYTMSTLYLVRGSLESTCQRVHVYIEYSTVAPSSTTRSPPFNVCFTLC